MTVVASGERPASSVLIVDGDAFSRPAIADYLRSCNYAVVEAASTNEAVAALGEPALIIDVILCDVSAIGPQSAKELTGWVRENRSELEVRLDVGTEVAAQIATKVSDRSLRLVHPYEPEAIVNYIERLRGSRAA